MINKPKEISYGVNPDLVAEPKFDGMRGIIRSNNDKFDLLSVRNDIYNSKLIQFPEIIPILPDDTEIDGEICIPLSDVSADFGSLQKRITVQNKQIIQHYTKTIPVKFMAFDILKYKGRDVTGLGYKERRDMLRSIITPEQQNIELVQVGTPIDMWNKVMEQDGEGIVVKNTHGKYNDQWFKQKNWKESDFKVASIEERKINWVLNLEDENKKDVGKVTMTGYDRTEELKQKIIGMTAVVKYLGFGNKLRIPILKELRS